MKQDTIQPAEEQIPDAQVEGSLTEDEKQEIVDQAEAQDINVDAGKEEVATEDDKGTSVWYDNLDADMKSDPNVTKYKSQAEFVKAHRELLGKLGKDKVVVPTDKSTPEEVQAFYSKLGKPDTAEDYLTPEVEMPEGVEIPETSIDKYKQVAYEMNLTKDQYEKLFEMQADLVKQQHEAEVAKYRGMADATETELRKEWGAAYEAKVEKAQKVINSFFKGKNIDKAFSVLANDKGFVQAMSDISEKLGEDVLKGEPRFTKTPAEAQLEVDQILGRRHPLSDAYFDELNPEHQAATDMVISLQTMAQAGQ